MLTPCTKVILSFLIFVLFLLQPVPIFSQFTTNGTATNIGGDCYRMTTNSPSQQGSIFNLTPVDLSMPFSVSGTMNFGFNNGGADGITFLFTTSTTALGIGGGGIAYEGIFPSVIIEWDTWQNAERGDPFQDHMGIMTNGNSFHTSPLSLAPPVTLPNIEDGQDHCFVITWDPVGLVLQASLDGITITFDGNLGGVDISDLFSAAPNVFFGFTSSTGGFSNEHRICFEEVQFSPMQDVQTCEGEPVQLNAALGGNSYSWSPTTGLSNPFIANPVATVSSTTLYTVTITSSCGSPFVDDVLVTVFPAPNVVVTNSGPYCVGDEIQLFAEGGTSYSWTGPNFNSTLQNPTIPNAQLSNGGLYTVVVTDANNCTATNATNVFFLPAQTFIVPLPPICTNVAPFQMNAIPPGGTWGGVADANGIVDPSILGGAGFYEITYSVIEPTGCFGEATYNIELIDATPINILSDNSFCEGSGIQTLSATPTGGFWSGVAATNGQIDVNSLGIGSHSVTYTLANGQDCNAELTFDINIFEAPEVTIQEIDPLCVNGASVTLIPSIAGGDWGGAANSSGIINPMLLVPGMQEVTYSVSSGGCTSSTSMMIDVLPIPFANIVTGGTVCENIDDSFPLEIIAQGLEPIQVSYSINGEPQTDLLLVNGSNILDVTQGGNYELTEVIDANNCIGDAIGDIDIQFVGYPEIVSFETICNANQTDFQISFEIQGGDPSSYFINSTIGGSLSTNPPYIFTSDFVPSGTNFSFDVSDANMCDVSNLSSSFSCVCLTDVGSLDTQAISVCEGEEITIIHDGNEVLDLDDILIFVLHDGTANPLGEIFEISSTPNVTFQPNMTIGTTYFVTAIAGNDDLMGGVDLEDGCLSVSLSVPVVWQELPNGFLVEDTSICLGENTDIIFELSGVAPFSVTFSDGDSDFILEDIESGFVLNVSPTETTEYELVLVADANCSQTISESIEVIVNELITQNVEVNVCEGEEVILEGEVQTESGTYTDVFPDVNGCDSTVITDLIVHFPDTTWINNSSCNPQDVGEFTNIETNENGCDSTIILTVIFSEVDTNTIASATCDPTMVGIFTNAYQTNFGCDSVVVETVSLLESDTTYLEDSSCNPQQVGEFISIETNENGCDSTIILTVIFSEVDTNTIASATCDPTMVGIFTNTYQTNFGCDSVVVETVSLLESDTTYLEDSSCNPQQVGEFISIETNENGCDSTIILTVIFSEVDTNTIASATCDPTMVGIFTNTYQTNFGCDSVVVETVSLLESDTTYLEDSSCNPQQVGEFISIETNENGCDSTIILTVIFSEVDTNTIASATCDPTMVGIFTNTYQTNFGCDSVVVETVSLLESDTTYLEDSSCNPQQVGEFISIETNENGCDSTIILTVIFSEVDTNTIASATCDPTMAGIFTNTYQTNFGCDSVVVETVSLLESDTTYLEDSSCNPQQVGEFISIETNENGCDSTIILTVIFSEVDTNTIASATCDPTMAGIFTNTYQTNFGCDSVVVETVLLLQSDTTELENTTCIPAEAGLFPVLLMNQFGCDSLILNNVILLQSDTTNIDLLTCVNDEVGEEIIILENQFGCDSTVIIITTLQPLNECGIEAMIEGSTIPCGEETGTISFELTQGVAPMTITWIGPSFDSEIVQNLNEVVVVEDLLAGNYVIEIIDANGFMIFDNIEIDEIIPPDVSIEILSVFGDFDLSCEGGTDGRLEAIANGGQAPYQYFWSTGEEVTQINNLAEGTYSVTVMDALNCENETEITLIAPPPLEITFEVADLDCFGENDGLISVLATGGVPPYTYFINGEDAQSDNNFFGLSAGTYEMSVEDANSCKVAEIIWINAPLPVEVELGDNIFISQGENTELNALVNVPFTALDTVIWSAIDSTECPTCLQQIIAPLVTTTYSVSVQGENGCSDSDALTIFVKRDRQIYVPNAFSPNNNGDNEIFMIFAEDNTVLKINEFKVVDRWGETLYQAYNFQPNDPLYGWDGSHRGQNMNSRVYVWYAVIEFLDGETEVFKGDVLLAR